MERNYLYTLAFLRRGDDILMLRRTREPWRGRWNGVGGKRQPEESPLSCIVREVAEETGFQLPPERLIFRGTMSWNDDFKAASKGLYLFTADIVEEPPMTFPAETPEGILAWKPISWVGDFMNPDVATNIPHFLPSILGSDRPSHFHCVFEGPALLRVEVLPFAE